MCKNQIAYNDGRDFFQWVKGGVLAINKEINEEAEPITDQNESKEPLGYFIEAGKTYIEMYTGNSITVSDDGDAVITLQATPSRDDENVSAYKLDFFIRDATKVIGITSMMITNKLYAMEAVDQFKEDYQFLLSEKNAPTVAHGI